MFKGLLLRIKATLQTDTAARRKLLDEAQGLQQRVLEIRRRQ